MIHRIETPPWTNFLYEPGTFKLVSGGRGSGKSYSIALALLILGAMRKEKILLAREFQKTIGDSSLAMLKTVAEAHPVLQQYYDFLPNKIISKSGTEWLFKGLSTTTSGSRSVRSIEGITITFLEEAQAISQHSWDELLPSVLRTKNARIFAAFNPTLPTDPVYKKAISKDKNVEHERVNWDKNPFFPPKLNDERLWLKKIEPELYRHIWEGELNDAANTQKFLLPPNLVEICFKAYNLKYEEGLSSAGYDIADEGFDYCAYAHRIGPVVRRIERWSGVGSTIGISTERVIKLMEEDLVDLLYYDSTGLGAGAKSAFAKQYGLRNKMIRPLPFNRKVAFPKKPYTSGLSQAEAFNNRFAQICWSVRLKADNTKRLVSGEDVNPQDCLFFHPELREVNKFIPQLSTPVYNYDNRQMKIDKYGEPEKETKRSPDMFDALMLAFASDSAMGIVPPYKKMSLAYE